MVTPADLPLPHKNPSRRARHAGLHRDGLPSPVRRPARPPPRQAPHRADPPQETAPGCPVTQQDQEHDIDPSQAGRGQRPKNCRSLGGRPHHRTGTGFGDRDPRRADDTLRPAHPPARRLESTAGPQRHRHADRPPTRPATEDTHLGPGPRAHTPRRDRGLHRLPHLLLRTTQPLATRHEREHERPPAAVLSQEHRPSPSTPPEISEQSPGSSTTAPASSSETTPQHRPCETASNGH